MTVETVLSDVLLALGIDRPSAQISSDDFEMRQIRMFMNDAGKDIAKRAEWERLQASLSVTGGTSSVPLPGDFQEMSETGAAYVVDGGPIRAVVAPEMWAFLGNNPSTQTYYHLRGGNIEFIPDIPAAGAVINYVSKNWVENSDQITENGDTLKIPERLLKEGTIWRWKRAKGLPYDDELAEFEAHLLADIKADRGLA